MRTLNYSPLYQSGFGLSHAWNFFDLSFDNIDHSSYPAYNLTTGDDDSHTLTLAVTGFNTNEIEIIIENNSLKIIGSVKDQPVNLNYLHQGICKEPFKREFKLGEFAEVRDAQLSNGLLTLNIERNVPEKMRARSIPINHAPQIGKKTKSVK